MNELSSVDLVLARARTGLSPSKVQLEDLEARIVGLPVPIAAPVLATPARVSRFAAFRATGGAGLFVAALLVSGGFLAGYFARPTPAANEQATQPVASNAPSAPALAPAAAAPAPRAEPAEAAASAPAPEPPHASSAGRGEGRAGPVRPRPAHSSPDVSAELTLLERIDRALRNSDAALALALLDELERSHPHTRLDEERRAARLLAECVAGSSGAAAAARNFLAARPASVYASRLHAVCKVE